MAENQVQQLSTQADLLSVVEDLERSIESLTEMLDHVRGTVKMVAEQVRLNDAVESPRLQLVAEASEVTSYVVPANGAHEVETPSQPEAIEKAADIDAEAEEAAAEAAREEVRRAVEQTRAAMSWSNLRVDAGFSFAGSESSSPPAVEFKAPPRVEFTAPAAPAEPEARHEIEVPSEPDPAVVEEPQALSEAEEPAMASEAAVEAEVEAPAEAPAPFVDDEARREEVRLAVERARNDMFGAAPAKPANEDEARREEVRRAVEDARNAMSWGQLKANSDWTPLSPEPGGFTIHPDQAPAVSFDPAVQAARKAALAGTTEPVPAPQPEAADAEAEPIDEEAAKRDEVRRAVEAARAEMMAEEAPLRLPDKPTIVPLVPRADAPSGRGHDFNGPPVIVIEDSEGRVELSQVFATLNKVDKSSQAALLNYSPHSVTIGLNMLTAMPTHDELVLAAQSVFGRVCEVRTEGPRTSIEIGSRRVGS